MTNYEPLEKNFEKTWLCIALYWCHQAASDHNADARCGGQVWFTVDSLWASNTAV